MDRTLIEQKLESLRRCLDRLRERCPNDARMLASNVDAQDIVALNLTRAVQLSVDIGAHWIADHPEIPAPSSMGQTFDALEQAGLLDANLAARLKKAVGFRNLAVHNYESINWEIVFVICTTRLVDFDEYARAVLQALLSAHSDGGLCR